MLTIGLLQCDHVNEEFLHISGDYDDSFRGRFAAVAPDITLRTYDVINGELPATTDECDGYITSGSRHSAYDPILWIESLGDFIQRLYADNVTFVGICFGHQLMAHVLGGTTEKSDRGWGVGVKRVEIEQNCSWMSPALPDGYALQLTHQDQVTQLPPNSKRLGGNAHCPNSIMMIGDHFLGIQAHPEMTAAYVRALVESRVERIGKVSAEAALASLSIPTDELVVFQWIANFFRKNQVRVGQSAPS